MMTVQDFARSCEALEVGGFTLRKAEYWGEAFGSWLIEFSSKTVPPHRITWDGRDRWLILQDERPVHEQTHRISFEEIRRMNYDDGATAYAQRQSGEWQDKWIGKIETEQSLDSALNRL